MSTTKKAPYTKVGEKDVEIVHALRNAGVSVAKISKITGRSPNTIKFLYEAKDLAEYRTAMAAQTEKYAKRHEQLVMTATSTTETEAEPEITDEPANHNHVSAIYEGDIKALNTQLNTIIAVLKAIEWKLPAREEKKEKKGWLGL